jgi:hypothetical protein
MCKLKLDVDELAVESFMAAPAPGEPSGTVHAHAQTRNANTCNNFSCQVGCTYQESCYMPCATD